MRNWPFFLPVLVRRYSLAFFIIIALSNNIGAVDPLEVFVNMPVLLDSKTEPSPQFDNQKSRPVPSAGATVEVQVFVPNSAGKPTFGFDLTFGLLGKSIADYLSLPEGNAFEGTPLSKTQNAHSVTALLLAKPTFPTNGYWCTVTFTVLSPLMEGDVLYLVRGSAGDINTDRDILDVSGASIQFSSSIEPIKGDLDLDGDVDFSDFLTFAGNFGKSGPTPSSTSQTSVQTVIVRDTVYIPVVDTIQITKTDTVYIVSNDSGIDPNSQIQLAWDFGGLGDRRLGSTTALNLSKSGLATIEIYAEKYSNILGMEGVIEFSNPGAVKNIVGQAGSRFNLNLSNKSLESNKFWFAFASLNPQTHSGTSPVHIGSILLEVNASTTLNLVSVTAAQGPDQKSTVFPNLRGSITYTPEVTQSNTYTNRPANYSIDVPEGWSVDDSNPTALTISNNSERSGLVVATAPNTGLTPDSYLPEFGLVLLEQTFSNEIGMTLYRRVSKSEEIVSGRRATEVTFTAIVQGEFIKGNYLFIIQPDFIYVFAFIAVPESIYNSMYPAYTTLKSSFTILGSSKIALPLQVGNLENISQKINASIAK